jgi:transcriptional regulator with XRE-family HTH domain
MCPVILRGMTQVRRLNPARIYQARLRAKLTQDDLAHRLRDHGVKASARYINRWERGVNTPRADVIPVLADALGVAILDLYTPNANDDEEAARAVRGSLTRDEYALYGELTARIMREKVTQ